MQREGLHKEMKLRKHYEKPSLKRAREKKKILEEQENQLKETTIN